MSAIGPKRTCHMSHLMSLLGLKRTCRFALHMSAFDPKQTWAVHCTCLLLTQSGHAACKYSCDCLIKLAFGPTRSIRARVRYFVTKACHDCNRRRGPWMVSATDAKRKA